MTFALIVANVSSGMSGQRKPISAYMKSAQDFDCPLIELLDIKYYFKSITTHVFSREAV